MMTDFQDPAFIEGQIPLDDGIIYSDMSPESHTSGVPSSNSPDQLGYGIHTVSGETGPSDLLGCESYEPHYIPFSTESNIHTLQALHHNDMAQQLPPYDLHQAGQNLDPRFPSDSPSASPATMSEFFQLMSQPEYVQAYMMFLQKQHEQQQYSQNPAPAPRSRSNSQPQASSGASTFTPRAASTDFSYDAQNREKKLAKYRTKRARRLTGSQLSSNDSSAPSTNSAQSDNHDTEQFMPSAKLAKSMAHDLEHRLINSEEEVKKLRSALESREAELLLLRHVIFEEQQFQQWAMQFGGDSSNASSSATSPRSSTPALVSSPSNASLGSSAMDTDMISLSMESSSIGSDHLEGLEQAQRRQEKLKQLGGPPSDVYHPWSHGITLNHPAFQQKEDWQSFELRPQERLARERLNYILMMHRYRLEQSQLASGGMSDEGGAFAAAAKQVDAEMAAAAAAAGNPSIHLTHPYTHQQSAFYQSPHHTHILTGSPVQGAGYWSGHFVPSTEKIDFSKISLRKTSSGSPPHAQPPQWPPQGPQSSPTGAQNGQQGQNPATTGHPASHPASPLSPHLPPMPNISPMPLSPQQMAAALGSIPLSMAPQMSPTAAIWRDAMAHPEMHHFPTQRSWIQEQPELFARSQASQVSSRMPFRRSAAHSTASSPSK